MLDGHDGYYYQNQYAMLISTLQWRHAIYFGWLKWAKAMTSQNDTLKQINNSGFPFQFRVLEEIRRTKETHSWSISTWEHPWTDEETGSSHFLDIVLQHNHSKASLVIECKRVRAEDSRQLQWAFLIPANDKRPVSTASCLEIESDPGNNREIKIWDEVDVTPDSFESEICILPSDETRNRPILEHLASQVLDSVEGLAQEELYIQRSHPDHVHLRRFIYPVIVTNASILVCQFKPDLIRIIDGTLDPASTLLTTVPFIRFRKCFDAEFPAGQFRTLVDANLARARTVFVVNAESLVEFLSAWVMRPKGSYAIQRILG